MEEYGMVGDGNHVVVALSGGTDSMVMLEIMANRSKYLPFKISLVALHVVIEDLPGYSNQTALENFTASLGIPLQIKIVQKGATIPVKGKSKCFVCSWHRRKTIFQTVTDAHAPKLALGHHLDDITETLFLNMMNHSEFSTMPPKLTMNKGNFDIIRPLALIRKSEIIRYAHILNIKNVEVPCPYAPLNQREELKQIINSIDAFNKKAVINIYKSMSNINPKYLPGYKSIQ